MKNSQKIILSFVFVLVTAFLTHYFFVQRVESKDRDIASFGERNSTPQIKWEQKVAEELANSAGTQVSAKPNWHDLLVYEYLSGQYNVSVKQGHIEKLELQPSMTGVKIKTKDFVEKYGRQMKTFANYKIESENPQSELVLFFDQQGGRAGVMRIERNDKGLVQNISIQ